MAAFCLSSLLWSCSDSKDEIDNTFSKEAHLVSGKVEKGPMVQGSSVELRTLDKDMTATGQSYTTTIENNNGDFNYGALKMNSPYAKLTADGYFFNEVSGELSKSTIKLDALVDLTDNTTINVNVITHLKSQRILNLVNSGKSFKEANKQAQEELLTQFGLQKYANTDASQYSISEGNDNAGALIAISSYILSDRSEAEIVEYLSKLTNEFKTTGQFSDDTKKRLQQTKYYLNGQLEKIQNNIVDRYNELGYNVNVKDLAYYFDWDDDGIAGNEIESNGSIKLSPNSVSVPAEGGTYTVTISSTKKCYLDAPSKTTNGDSWMDVEPNTSTTEEYYSSSLYETGYTSADMDYSASIEGNTLKIEVKPAQFRKTKEAYLYVYNARGENVGVVLISQTGNSTKSEKIPGLGEMGRDAVRSYASSFASAFSYARTLEKYFLDNKQPVSPNNNYISSSWQNFYSAVLMMARIKDFDDSEGGYYQDFCNAHLAMLYMKMSSLWGGVPYYTSSSIDTYMLSRTNESELLNTLAKSVEDILPYLDEKKNVTNADENGIFFISKDVARFLLAQIYCNLKDYSKAKSLLENIVSNGYYSLVESGSNTIEEDETIFGLLAPNITRASSTIMPFYDYKDVLLLLSECDYNMGGKSAAADRVKKVAKSKGVTLNETEPLNMIAETRVKLSMPNTLAFLRRNSLGSYLGLNSNQNYMLLWPIPWNDMVTNPNMTQNPGY